MEDIILVTVVMVSMAISIDAETAITGLHVSNPETVSYTTDNQTVVNLSFNFTNVANEPFYVNTVVIQLTDALYPEAVKKSKSFECVFRPFIPVPAKDRTEVLDRQVGIRCDLESCRFYKYLCATIKGQKIGSACISLTDTEGGVVRCADFAIDGFSMDTTEQLIYTINDGVPIKALTKVHNMGKTDIPESTNELFAVKAYFTDSARFYDKDTIKLPDGGISTTPADNSKLKQAYDSNGDKIDIQLTSDIVLPQTTCNEFTHLCMVLEVADVINDAVEENNFHCLPLGKQPLDNGAGIANCTTTSGGANLKLNAWSWPLLTLPFVYALY